MAQKQTYRFGSVIGSGKSGLNLDITKSIAAGGINIAHIGVDSKKFGHALLIVQSTFSLLTHHPLSIVSLLVLAQRVQET